MPEVLDVVRGPDIRSFVGQDGIKEKPLSDVRKLFAARQPPLMLKDDRFQRDGGSVVDDSDEPSLKLADVLSGQKVTIKAGAPAASGEKDITVLRGEAKLHHRVTLTDKLSALRTALGVSMEAGDRFLTGAGGEVSTADEATLTVATLLGEKDTITIRAAAAAPGETAVTVKKGTDSKLHKIKTTATLAELRTALGSWLTSADRFKTKSGAKIDVADEATFTIADVADKDVVEVAVKEGLTPGTPDTPVVPKPTPTDPKWGLTLGASDKEPLAALTREFGTPGGKIPWMSYPDLKIEIKRSIFSVLQLNRALVMKNGLEDQPALSKSYYEAINVIPVKGEVRAIIPPESMREVTRMTTSKTVQEMRKRGVKTSKASAGAYGVALSAEYSQETESLSFLEKSTTYFLSEYIVAKVGYRLDRADITPTAEFTAAVNAAVTGKSSLQQYLDLLTVLDQYGHFVLTQCTAGGKMMFEKEELMQNSQEAERALQSFGVAVNVEVNSPKGKFSGGAGYGQSDDEAKNKIIRLALGSAKTTVWGGMPAMTGTPADWVESVNNPLTWAVVVYEQLTPSIMYLDSALRNRCMGLIDQHFLNGETAKVTVLDMHAYVAQLREQLFREETGL